MKGMFIMKRIDFNEAKFYKASLKGVDFYVTECRLIVESVPDELFMYETRHETDDWCQPVTIEHHVLVDFCNTILSKTQLIPDGFDCIYIVNNDDFIVDYNTMYNSSDIK